MTTTNDFSHKGLSSTLLNTFGDGFNDFEGFEDFDEEFENCL